MCDTYKLYGCQKVTFILVMLDSSLEKLKERSKFMCAFIFVFY